MKCDYYSLREVSVKLGVHYNTVVQMVSRGDLVVSVLGKKKRMIHKDDFVLFVKSRRVLVVDNG